MVFICLILNASSYRCISSLIKLCPLSVNIRLGTENIYVGDERTPEPSLRNSGKTPSIVI